MVPDPRHGPVPTNTTITEVLIPKVNVTSVAVKTNVTAVRVIHRPIIETPIGPLYILTLIPLIILLILLLILVIRIKYVSKEGEPVIKPVSKHASVTYEVGYVYLGLKKLIHDYYLKVRNYVNKYVKLHEGETPREVISKLSDDRLRSLIKPLINVYEETIYGLKEPTKDDVEYIRNIVSKLVIKD